MWSLLNDSEIGTTIRVLPQHEPELHLHTQNLLTVQLTVKKLVLQAGKLVTYIMKSQNICSTCCLQ